MLPSGYSVVGSTSLDTVNNINNMSEIVVHASAHDVKMRSRNMRKRLSVHYSQPSRPGDQACETTLNLGSILHLRVAPSSCIPKQHAWPLHCQHHHSTRSFVHCCMTAHTPMLLQEYSRKITNSHRLLTTSHSAQTHDPKHSIKFELYRTSHQYL